MIFLKFNVILGKKDDYSTINNINSLSNKKVYVLKNSILESMLKKQKNITIKTYESDRELVRLSRKDVLICVDKKTFETYSEKFKNFSVKYEETINKDYTFKLNGDATLYKLMNSYFKTLDPKDIATRGLDNYETTYKKGTMLAKIAEYLLYILIVVFIVFIVLYRFSKKIKIQKKIK